MSRSDDGSDADVQPESRVTAMDVLGSISARELQADLESLEEFSDKAEVAVREDGLWFRVTDPAHVSLAEVRIVETDLPVDGTARLGVIDIDDVHEANLTAKGEGDTEARIALDDSGLTLSGRLITTVEYDEGEDGTLDDLPSWPDLDGDTVSGTFDTAALHGVLHAAALATGDDRRTSYAVRVRSTGETFALEPEDTTRETDWDEPFVIQERGDYPAAVDTSDIDAIYTDSYLKRVARALPNAGPTTVTYAADDVQVLLVETGETHRFAIAGRIRNTPDERADEDPGDE